MEKDDGSLYRTLLTQERHAIIVQSFENGLSSSSAASYASVSKGTLDRWRIKGQKAIQLEEDGESIGHLIIYAEFERDVQGALAKFEKKHVENIEDHSETHWSASKFLLERRRPKEWGPKRELVNAGPSAPQKLEVTLTLGELRGTPNPPIEVPHAVVEDGDPILIGPASENDGSDDDRKQAD
jgi:transposase-like protein